MDREMDEAYSTHSMNGKKDLLQKLNELPALLPRESKGVRAGQADDH
jgi:hypothetical protein